MKKIRIRGLFMVIVLAMCSAVSVKADASRSWSLKHKNLDATFFGNIIFSDRNWPCKSVVTYSGNVGGKDRELSMLTVDAFGNFYRSSGNEVGTIMISTKNCHNGNCVKEYVAYNHIVKSKQYKDYLTQVNVELQFGTIYDYVTERFRLTD